MRQLKQVLKTKKNEIHGCGTSQCVTLNCRRLNDEFCGCGDGGGGGGDIPITNLYNLPMGQEIFPGETVTLYFNYEPDNATNVDEQINIYALNISGEIVVSSGMGGQLGEYYLTIRGISPGEAEVECDLNGTPYFSTPVTVVEPIAVESCDFPANMVVYTGGGAGVNQNVGEISYSPTNATHPENQISLAHYDGGYIGDFYLRDCENGDGIIWFNGAPDDYVGRTVTYKGMINGEYISDIDVEVKKGVSVIDYEFLDVELGVGEINQNNWFAVTDYTGDIESLEITQDDNIANVLFNEEIVDGHIILRVYVVGRAEGNTRLQIEDTRGHLYGFNINVTEAVIPVESVYNVTQNTNVFNGGSEGFNLDVGSFEYTPTNANQVYDDVTFVPSNEDVGTLYISNANNGVATLGFNPSMESSQIGNSFSYDAYLGGEPVGSSINLYTNEGTRIASANFSDITLQVGNVDSSNNFELDDNAYLNSINVVYDDSVISVGFIDNGTGYDIQITGVNEGNTYFQVEDVYGNILGFNVTVTSGGDIPITSMSGIANSIEVMEDSGYSCILYYEPTNATNPEEQIQVSIQNLDGVAQINAAYVINPGEYYLEIIGVSAGSATFTISLNGDEYSIIPITIEPSIHVESISNFPNYVEVYTGGSGGLNQDIIEFDYSPTDANYVPSDIGLSPLGDSIGDFWIGGFGSGHASFAYSPIVGDETIGNEYGYNVLLNGDTVGATTFHINKGVQILDGSNTELYINIGETNTDNWIRLDNYGYGTGSLKLSYNSYMLNVELVEGLDEQGNDIIWVKVEGVTSGSSTIYITDISGHAVYFIVNVN